MTRPSGDGHTPLSDPTNVQLIAIAGTGDGEGESTREQAPAAANQSRPRPLARVARTLAAGKQRPGDY